METLVLHPGALGDIILSLPALGLLRRRFPETKITLAGEPEFVAAVAGGIADRTRSLSEVPLHRLYSEGPLADDDVLFWKSFERIVSWTGAGDALFGERLRLAGGDVIVAGWKPDSTETRHVARIFIESLYPSIPRVQSVPKVRIEVDPLRRRDAQTWLAKRGWTPENRLVALHPGAGSAAKRWDVRNFRQLALRCQAHGCRQLIIEGPAETGLGRELMRDLTPGALFAGSLPLAFLAALIAHCSGFVGNDSGISHLAAGLGVSSVVLFGPTAPEQWAPVGDRVTILQDRCLERIPADRVWRALATKMH